jgi:hypothetical protein
MPTTVGKPTAVLASAGAPTAAEMPETLWTSSPHEFSQKFAKKPSERRKIRGKKTKITITIAHFLVRYISASPIVIGLSEAQCCLSNSYVNTVSTLPYGIPIILFAQVAQI